MAALIHRLGFPRQTADCGSLKKRQRHHAGERKIYGHMVDGAYDLVKTGEITPQNK
jgi:hypothetical protein